MSSLNWVDFIILAIFFFSMVAGFGRGFVKEMVSLATLIVAFIVAATFTSPLAHFFTSSAPIQSAVTHASNAIGADTAQPVSYAALGISFALLFAGTVVVGSLISYLLNVAFQTGILGLGNRLLGGIFGLCRGFIINLVLIFLLQLTPMATHAAWQQSQFVSSFQPAVQWLGNFVAPGVANLKARFGSTLQNAGQSVTQFIKQ